MNEPKKKLRDLLRKLGVLHAEAVAHAGQLSAEDHTHQVRLLESYRADIEKALKAL